MTIKPGEYADVLRALGQSLEREQATNIVIRNDDESLSVTWTGQADPDAANREERQLALLHEQAKAKRFRGGRDARGGLAEALRTLGQDLDQSGGDLVRIVQNDDGWTLTYSREGAEIETKCRADELQRRSLERRALRDHAAEPEEGDSSASGLQARTGPLSRRFLRHDT